MKRGALKSKIVLIVLVCIIIIAAMHSVVPDILPGQVRASTTLSESSSSISAYSDPLATLILTNFNWGAVALNVPVTQTFYLKDTDPSIHGYAVVAPSLTDFVFKDSNGNVVSAPSDAQFFNVTIDRIGAIMSSGQIMSAALTLVISSDLPSNVTSFSFNVVLNFNQLISPADVNQDGQVNFNDIAYFLGLYINYFATGTYSQTADLDHTGVINFGDVITFTGYYEQYYQSLA
ncbi:MAG TPA: hypothetical protein VK536_09490 [Candidatus Limnocylindrales bacterium]|nr:hypothetical protein [Candidatus Limnocylindrales bacterium]